MDVYFVGSLLYIAVQVCGVYVFAERVPAMQLNSVLLRSTVVAALGGLLFGFDTVVISGTTQALTDLFHLTPFALGLTVSSALAGTIIGSMLAGIPGDAYGRRDTLRILRFSISFRRLAAVSRGVGARWSSFGSSAAWPLAGRRF